MATTENYRISTILDAFLATIQRIEFLAQNGGSLAEIARETAKVQDFALAVNGADSDEQITSLISAV